MMRAQAGFTLIEIMAAVAILGIAMFVLLDSHYTALRLYDSIATETIARQLLETTVQEAEVKVLEGEMAGEGDFGNRYPEFTWTYEAEPLSEDEEVQLYQVSVTLNGGEEPRTMVFLTYAITPPDDEGIFSENSGSGSSGSRGSASGRSGSTGTNTGGRRRTPTGFGL
ncbi:MAG: prepilin-type N-terminal cleavage/methylation domain-containing protein [Candidatus Hydrogenedens sp.]|nr:prepilin-type N-terminal cleavage/methylation domain-containing protein [Candidatus Hydrogenedens sp.]